MSIVIVESPLTLMVGLLVGFLFGFLLQKSRLATFDIVIGQFLFKDFTLVRFLLSALIVGGVSLYSLQALGFVTTIPAAHSSIFGSLLGGAFLGLGMALLGYCPGSTLAAIGQGSNDAFFGILGLSVGALSYEAIKPYINSFLTSRPHIATLPELTGLSPWVFLGALAITALFIFSFLRYNNL